MPRTFLFKNVSGPHFSTPTQPNSRCRGTLSMLRMFLRHRSAHLVCAQHQQFLRLRMTALAADAPMGRASRSAAPPETDMLAPPQSEVRAVREALRVAVFRGRERHAVNLRPGGQQLPQQQLEEIHKGGLQTCMCGVAYTCKCACFTTCPMRQFCRSSGLAVCTTIDPQAKVHARLTWRLVMPMQACLHARMHAYIAPLQLCYHCCCGY